MSNLNGLQDQTWFQVLREEVANSSISDVARLLGYSRPTVSLVMSGKYKGGTDLIAAKVISTFTTEVSCPHLSKPLPQAVCGDFQSRAQPSSDPKALRHWIACRAGCPYFCKSTESEAS